MAVREQGPETGLVCLYKYHSKTCMNENPSHTPSDAHPTSQQKRHPARGALKNGGSNRTRTPDLLQISPRARRWWRQKRPVWP